MKEVYLLLVVICLACSRPPGTFNNPYGVTAMLNDSAWFGMVQAINSSNFVEKPCAEGKVTLMIKTDIPYPGNGSYSKSEVVNGCAGECVSTQWLTFFNVPLKKGKYSIDKLNECGMFNKSETYNYSWHINGSGLIRVFKTQPKKTNWVRVTRYNSQTKTIEGRFEANLADYTYNTTDSSGRVASFRQGRFIARLPKK